MSYLFMVNRPNPYDVTGAIVGGPTAEDKYIDERNEYHYTEVAIDYNCALTMAVVSAMSGPGDLFKGDCSWAVPNYPKSKLKPIK
jgi:Glycosyl hydrolase family 9